MKESQKNKTKKKRGSTLEIYLVPPLERNPLIMYES